MKKFLSLVLALVMTMSLVTVSAGAKDFADAKDITYTEAVDVLSTLGVLEGDETGFRPTDTLKRSEAAKIICALNLTPKTAASLSADTNPFADVAKSHWAAGYIAEGVQSGIIAGVGDNKFAPDADLTGYAFLKMLLVSLGYDATIEGMTGANWSVNVAKLADEIELTKGNDDFVGSKAVTREEAALYALNTLKAELVKYDDKGTQITINGVVIATGASSAEGKGKTYMEENYKKLSLDDGEEDSLGRPSNYWEYDGDEIGTYASEADYVLVAKKDTTMAKLIEDNDLDKKIKTGFTGSAAVECGEVVEFWMTKKNADTIVTYAYETVVVEDVYEVDEEEELAEDYGVAKVYTLVSNNEADLGDKTYVDALSESKTGYKAIGNYEEDDVLMVLVDADDDLVKVLGVAETLDGVKTAYGTNYVKVDGVKYPIVAGKTAPNYDDTYTYYLDPNGVIVDSELAKEGESALEYVYVMKVDAQDENSALLSSKDNLAKVKVMYVDGEAEVLTYALATDKNDNVTFKLNGEKVDYSEAAFEAAVTTGWYAYTLNSDGEVTLKSATKEDKSATLDVSVEKNVREVADDVYATTSTTVTVLNKKGVVKSYKGYKNFPSTALVAEDALVVYGSTEDYASAIYVYDADAESDADKIDVALYVSSGDTTEDGKVMTFYVEGEKVSYTVENYADVTVSAGQLFEIDVDEDDIATISALVEDTDYVRGEVGIVSDDYITVDGTEIDLADDCAVYQVSLNGKTVSNGTLKAEKNVVVILNSDDEATEIFIYKDITILD